MLGRALRVGEKQKMNDQEIEVYRRIQKILIDTHGHAEYYENRIKTAQRRQKSAMGTYAYGPATNDYQNEKMYGFETLGHLPSPETVRVLGDFLFDDWVSQPDLKPPDLESPASSGALRALATLPLENKPIPVRPDRLLPERDIHPWRLWYQQVKAGTRPFRFEGDPQEYNLDGPVRVAMDGPTTTRPSRRVGETGGQANEEKKDNTTGRVVVTSLAGVLCVFALWKYLALKREATGSQG